jgi:hypothetical protein
LTVIIIQTLIECRDTPVFEWGCIRTIFNDYLKANAYFSLGFAYENILFYGIIMGLRTPWPKVITFPSGLVSMQRIYA